MKTQVQETIPFQPVKSFFVHMLTRDISLKNAILDLIDNCVDGIQRSETKSNLQKKEPYDGYWTKISFSKNEFVIEDNCGGIPWKNHDYAFRMGRPDPNIDKGLKTVGVYGIGMKRAIFKIGEDCIIETHSTDKSYQIHLSSDWIKKDDDWNLTPTQLRDRVNHGTKITIREILKGIDKEFESQQFYDDFYSTVATHFAFIIDKGFKIYVNNRLVIPKSLKLLFANSSSSVTNIRPFIYKATIDGVDVFLTVGFTRPIPSSEEANESFENYKERYSSAEAGWSVICNDRTVLYCDKTSLTGWGVSGVPQYHMQFIAISGVVIFNSKDASLLPTTTTKQGINANSNLYLQVRDKMIEGMKMFTQYTNHWKSKELVAESKKLFTDTSVVDIEGVKQKISSLKLKSTRGTYIGQQYSPNLPKPIKENNNERITFSRPSKEIKQVSSYLKMPNHKPSEIGNKCFEIILQEAIQ